MMNTDGNERLIGYFSIIDYVLKNMGDNHYIAADLNKCIVPPINPVII